jgi:tetratricopeptide (TPR) repeat protein
MAFVQIAVGAQAEEETSYVFDVVKHEGGPALLSALGTFDVAQKGRTRTAEAHVDARLLPPGDYGFRFTVSARGTPMATLFTPFSLDRPVRPLGAGADTAATLMLSADAVRFRREDVLEPSVLVPFLEEVARFAPKTSRAAIEQARGGRFDEALQQLKPGGPTDPTAPFLRGLSALARGELQPASVEFRAAIAAAPELLVGAFYIGACYAAGGKDTPAINAWQTSLIGLDRYPAVYRFMADALIRTGQPERARALAAKALSRWPDDEALRARAARATFETGRYDQAFEYVDQIIERQPADTSVLFFAMRSAFQAVMEGADVRLDALLPRLRRYRDLYVAAGGLQQALVAEWVAFVEARARGGNDQRGS